MELCSTGGSLRARLGCERGTNARRARAINARGSQENPELVDSALESARRVPCLQNVGMGCRGSRCDNEPSRLRCPCRRFSSLPNGHGELQSLLPHHLFQCRADGHCGRIQPVAGFDNSGTCHITSFAKGGVRRWRTAPLHFRTTSHLARLCARNIWGAQ
jgi:hypothetical protein